MSVFQQIITTATELGWLQWLAFLFGIAYVILAAKENPWCWPVGIASVLFSFFVYIDPEVKLYSDATLQVFYAIISIYGWWTWTQESDSMKSLTTSNRSKEETKLEISTLPWTNHLMIIVGGILLAGVLGMMWEKFGAALPYVDAMTTSFSVIATVLVTRKILENWIYWIIIDTACIFIYIHRELYLFSLLFLIYGIVAVIGYMNWKRNAVV